MIKLGKLTDYAIAVMGQLSKEGGTVSRSAHYLSDKTGVPEPTVAKVLKLLAKENLVESLRGAAGGYKLSKAPEEISMGEIITALEGPIELVACVEGSAESCNVSATCPVRGRWDPLNNAIKEALGKVKLADMVPSGCENHEQVVMRGMK
jgi:FeS assembly SUF system regulator